MLPLGWRIRSALPCEDERDARKHSQGEGYANNHWQPRGRGEHWKMLTNAGTERSREGGRHLLEQGDALQIFMGNLGTAEMRDPPGRVANNVKSVVEHSI